MNIRWTVLSALVMWVATCGQKGPLELPPTATSQPAVQHIATGTPQRS